MDVKLERRARSSRGLACPVEERERLEVIQRGLRALSGKWKGEILCLLFEGPKRFNELRRGIPPITQHMLSAQLRDLEKAGLVIRHVYDEVPPRVEYEMSEAGHAFKPVAEALYDWSVSNLPAKPTDGTE